MPAQANDHLISETRGAKTPAASEGRGNLARKSLWRRLARDSRGGQLLEFAFSLPFLAVIAVGVMDFGGAYTLKHKLTGAAREGARIVVSNPTTDSSCTDSTPCSVEGAATAVQNYLVNGGLSLASCISPDSPTSSSNNSWGWTCNGVTLSIDHGYVITPSGSSIVIPATHVTLSYPYSWSFGTVITLLGGNPSTMPSTLSSDVIMQNLVN
jgi:Flp pilus assembly protein TadG